MTSLQTTSIRDAERKIWLNAQYQMRKRRWLSSDVHQSNPAARSAGQFKAGLSWWYWLSNMNGLSGPSPTSCRRFPSLARTYIRECMFAYCMSHKVNTFKILQQNMHIIMSISIIYLKNPWYKRTKYLLIPVLINNQSI